MGHTSSMAELIEDLASFQPTFLLVVPRVFEKVYAGARAEGSRRRQGQDLRRGTRRRRSPTRRHGMRRPAATAPAPAWR